MTKPLSEEDNHQINVDIKRSYGNNEKYLFTQRILHRMLHVAINRGVEYTQGMNYIALHVLMFCWDDAAEHPSPEIVDAKF